ncbi:MAG TPA: phosphocholine cytidylyltransferase family protein [Nevskia sp.]|nr:phosphocholine cytidylyltransferase family protein [Nevskia sp.]
MRAIILAAGLGKRLTPPGQTPPPKCLLKFGGQTLLERHLKLLRQAGIDEVVIAVGYAPQQIEAELDRLRWQPRPRLVLNQRYELGSVLSVHCVAEALTAGGDVLLMDADVLYDRRMLDALCAGAHADRMLMDRGFQPGEEPVKICLRDGVPVEFRKRLAPDLVYDTWGESVGFFRFTEDTAKHFAELVRGYIDSGRADQPHEEAIRDLLLENPARIDTADVTGAPWLEIDFPADLVRARDEILPQLQSIP